MCKMWRAESVSVYTPRRLPGKLKFPASEMASLNEKTTVQSRMRIAKNSNFYSTSNRHAAPDELMKTKMLDAASFTVTLKDNTSTLFEN